MKKIKVMAIAIVAIIITVSIILISPFANKVDSYSGSGEKTLAEYESEGWCRWGSSARYISLMADDVLNCNNIYCVEKGQVVADFHTEWVVKSKAVITGDDVEFYTLSKSTGWKFEKKGKSGIHNNKLAAILCEGELGRYTSGLGATNSQESLWSYWNTWVSASGASSYMASASGNSGSYDSDYDWYAENYDYSVTVYFLLARPDLYSGYQNLILVERDDKTPREPETTEVTVTKKWNDGGNTAKRQEITVTLKANGKTAYDADGNTVKAVKLTGPNWTYTFTNLPESDSSGNTIKYTIEEGSISGYESGTPVETATNTFTITNTLLTDITVQKEWVDEDDLDDLRPSSIKVTLYAGGVKTDTAVLNEDNNWSYTFENLRKYNSNGKEITYKIEEDEIEGYTSKTTKNEDTDGNIIFKITNTHTPSYEGYIEITGKVWNDGDAGKSNDINGTFGDDSDSPIQGIKVRLRDKNGNLIQSTYTDVDGKFTRTDYAETAADGTYTIRVNYDNSENVYKLYKNADEVKSELEEAYVEFEYDGMEYTTVRTATTGENTSKAKEDENARNTFDSNHSEVTTTTDSNVWTDRNIKAVTKDVITFKTYTDRDTTKTSEEQIKYCNGNGTYDRTDPDENWKVIKNIEHDCDGKKCDRTYNVNVEVIQNVNLGLFKREQPDVALDSDIKKVEVEMRGQRYTYVYGVQTDIETDIQAKFQNKESYTYRMPVNPADVSYLENVDASAMNIYVTYEISIGNASNTLTITVDDIVNYYDSNYEIESITLGTFKKTTGEVTGTSLSIPTSSEKTGTDGKKYKQITLTGLGITVTAAQDESENKIYIKYKVSQSQLVSLFNDEAPLNNASEILRYSTTYGTKTLYAEEQQGGRMNANGTGKPYAGYDYNSHPGNAGINLVKETDSEGKEVYRLRSTDNLVKYTDENGNVKTKPEDDTDIAPAFVLCKDTPQILSGTVWEDTQTDDVNRDGSIDADLEEDERLGNGYQDDAEEKAANVKVELYNFDGSRAKLYNESNGKLDIDAITYSNQDGNYSFNGVVTGEYFIKFTYGDDTTELNLGNDVKTTIQDGTVVNARNYKSTIITNSTIKDVMNKAYENFTEDEKKWHITHEDRYSVAVDNMRDRLAIKDLKNGNFDDGETMTAYTKPFKTQVEFETSGIGNIDSTQIEQTGDETIVKGKLENVSNTLDKLDFGIIERPQEELIIQKTITHFKITLSNGQILAEGNPNEDTDINYTKSMGFRQDIQTAKQAEEIDIKRLLVEIDTELIQGAQLEVTYSVKIKNNNEIDYDYGDVTKYTDLVEDVTTGECDKYIVNDSNPNAKYAKYYYYGEKSGLDKLDATIEFVDYLDKNLVYDNNATDSRWYTVSDFGSWYVGDNDSNNLISNDVKSANIENNYKVLQYNWDNDDTTTHDTVTIARTEWTQELTMTATKTLANQDDNSFDNNAEIIRIDAKTARTVKAEIEGTSERIEYIPGNYIPGVNSAEEVDDDRVDMIITPPTGITKYITTYLIATLVGLTIIFVGVIFIKKKVLTR